MKKKSILLILVAVITVVVTIVVSGLLPILTKQVARNQEISGEVNSTLDKLNKQVLTALEENNFQKFYQVCTENFADKLKNDLAPEGDLFAKLQRAVKSSKFEEVDSYQISMYRLRDDKELNLEVDSSLDQKPVSLQLKSISSNIYVAFLKSNGGSIGHLLTLIYRQQEGNWKLDNLNCREYTYQGQTAVDYYKQAQQLADKGFIVGAYLYALTAEELSLPSNFLRYSQDYKFTELKNELSRKIANELPYPIEVTSLPHRPIIFRVQVKNLKQGLAAVIKYKTSLNLQETEKLQAELDKLTPEVLDIFPGLADNFKYLAYQIYSKTDSDGNYYGTVVDLEKDTNN